MGPGSLVSGLFFSTAAHKSWVSFAYVLFGLLSLQCHKSFGISIASLTKPHKVGRALDV